MCDYSLHNVKNRAAKIGDLLMTRKFNNYSRGFFRARRYRHGGLPTAGNRTVICRRGSASAEMAVE